MSSDVPRLFDAIFVAVSPLLDGRSSSSKPEVRKKLARHGGPTAVGMPRSCAKHGLKITPRVSVDGTER
jgi:hypothetical protein